MTLVQASLIGDRTNNLLNHYSKYQDYEKFDEAGFTLNKKTKLRFEFRVQKSLSYKESLLKRSIKEIKTSIVRSLTLLNPNYSTDELKFYIMMGDSLGTHFGSYVHHSRIFHIGLSNWEKKFKDIDLWESRGMYELNKHFLAAIFGHEFFHFHQFYFYDWTQDNPSQRHTKKYRELMAQTFEGLYLISLNLESYMMEYFYVFRIYNNPLVDTRVKSRFSAYTYLSQQFRCISKYPKNTVDLKLNRDWEQRCIPSSEVKQKIKDLVAELFEGFKPNYSLYNEIIEDGRTLSRHFSSYFMNNLSCNISVPYHDVAYRESKYQKLAQDRMSFKQYNSITDNWRCMSLYYAGDSKSESSRRKRESVNIPFRTKAAI